MLKAFVYNWSPVLQGGSATERKWRDTHYKKPESMMNEISSDGNKYFWRTSKNPRRIQFIKPPPEYPHLSFIYCLFCLPDTQLFNLSKDPYRLSEDLGLSEHWKLRQNNRYLQRIKENRRLIHTPLNELHTPSKVDTYAAQRVTYVIEGQYIRRSTSYIRHRRSIHTPLNELHMSSKVDTMIFLSR